MAGTALHGRLTWQTAAVTSAPGEPLAITVERWWGLEAHVGEVDVVFDVIGRDILDRSTELVRRAAPSSP